MKSIARISLLCLLLSTILGSSAWATKYAYWDSEDQACGAELPAPPWSVIYPYRRMSTFCDVPGTPSGRKSYGVKYDYATYGNNVINRLTKMSGWPIALQKGKTYYMAVRFRIDRINGNNVFHSDGQSGSKFIEIDGSGIRWLVSIGHWTGQPLKPGHFSIRGGNPTYHLNPELESRSAIPPNANGYSWENQPQLAYERWHSVVVALKVANDHSGSWELWANGDKIQEFFNIQTAANSTPTISEILHLGTIAQPAYDAPPFYVYFDDLLLTDNWQDIKNGGYMSGTPTPQNLAPSPPVNLRITGAN